MIVDRLFNYLELSGPGSDSGSGSGSDTEKSKEQNNVEQEHEVQTLNPLASKVPIEDNSV